MMRNICIKIKNNIELLCINHNNLIKILLIKPLLEHYNVMPKRYISENLYLREMLHKGS